MKSPELKAIIESEAVKANEVANVNAEQMFNFIIDRIHDVNGVLTDWQVQQLKTRCNKVAEANRAAAEKAAAEQNNEQTADTASDNGNEQTNEQDQSESKTPQAPSKMNVKTVKTTANDLRTAFRDFKKELLTLTGLLRAAVTFAKKHGEEGNEMTKAAYEVLQAWNACLQAGGKTGFDFEKYSTEKIVKFAKAQINRYYPYIDAQTGDWLKATSTAELNIIVKGEPRQKRYTYFSINTDPIDIIVRAYQACKLNAPKLAIEPYAEANAAACESEQKENQYYNIVEYGRGKSILEVAKVTDIQNRVIAATIAKAKAEATQQRGAEAKEAIEEATRRIELYK